ncbi:MAG TPA: signal recognition particle-docking protein FtsY [Acidimicrobiia bacterium]
MTDYTLIIVIVAVVVVAVIGFFFWRSRDGGATPMAPAPTAPTRKWGRILTRVWGDTVDDATWERLEEALLAADVGVAATDRVVSAVRSRRPGSVEEAERMVSEALLAEFSSSERALDLVGSPAVVIVVGVNGSGKTTSIAKLARRLAKEGRSVRLAAADTFRAAAVDQLRLWAERLGVGFTSGPERGDPAAVAHDAIAEARSAGNDVVIVDTAGRLHSDRNLMEELRKVHRVASQAGRVSEVLLVLDATAGQNGLAQVREFANAVPLTGVILAKLDGTARGGIVVAVESDLGVPIKFAGVGEGPDDLEVFDPARFVADLTA